MKSIRLAIAAVIVLTLHSAAFADDLHVDLDHYKEQIRPFLVRHCQGCHGGKKPKGDFHLDLLTWDFHQRANVERRRIVLKRLKAGEMPPKSKPRPPERDLQTLCDWVAARVNATADSLCRQGPGGFTAAQPGGI